MPSLQSSVVGVPAQQLSVVRVPGGGIWPQLLAKNGEYVTNVVLVMSSECGATFMYF